MHDSPKAEFQNTSMFCVCVCLEATHTGMTFLSVRTHPSISRPTQCPLLLCAVHFTSEHFIFYAATKSKFHGVKTVTSQVLTLLLDFKFSSLPLYKSTMLWGLTLVSPVEVYQPLHVWFTSLF
jgi:hypothetical protein